MRHYDKVGQAICKGYALLTLFGLPAALRLAKEYPMLEKGAYGFTYVLAAGCLFCLWRATHHWQTVSALQHTYNTKGVNSLF